MGGAIARILIADDDESIRRFSSSFLIEHGYTPLLARDGQEAIDLVHRERPDLVILDIDMPGVQGIEVCRHIKTHPELRWIPVVIVTSMSDVPSRVAGLSAGADDFFTKPMEPTELQARIRSLLKLKHYMDELDHAEKVITSLALCVEAKDTYTAGHCTRLAHYASVLGQALRLSERELRILRLGGMLHDLGKIGVPDAVLLKPGPLTAAERIVVEQHPATGAQLCEPLQSFKDLIPVIKHHHEKWNGTGYPGRMKGEEIPLTARIMAIVDVFDALHTRRPYKPALSKEESLKILEAETAKGFWDPNLVQIFIKSMTQKNQKS